MSIAGLNGSLKSHALNVCRTIALKSFIAIAGGLVALVLVIRVMNNGKKDSKAIVETAQ